ncbi:UNVERIFIED_CONTAM: hypothetical protein GTU68_063653, partial [Idotea baltica]|nr:hypothetical protein [Idotea baltica]
PQREESLVRDHVSPPQSKDKKSVRFGEEIALSELPIPPEEAKKWVNMKKVELDKLKWMTDVPEPKPLKGKEGFVARFSFNGDLLPYDSDVSWREGLHHHGEEPGRAGYTLDELFLFVRSQVVQQRHLGLKTIAHILRNAKEGLYDTCFNTSILQLMVDAGIVLLLRFSIDETTALVYQEALRALYFLVGNEPDETCLSIAEPWSPLGLQPGVSSHTHSKEKDREELDAEEKELKDVEVIKLDMVRALVRMDVHIRLRYLLESVQLSPPDVVHILGILKRIARHSLTAAWSLVNTPRLIATITKHFLPHNTSPLLCGGNIDKLTSVYGVPLSQALSLMKVLASRGRQIATTLIEEQDLISRIMAYVSMEPTEVQMPITQVLSLAQEAYSLWAVFLSYGLAKSQQGFSTFYPLFVKQLIFYRDKVDINDKLESNQFNYEVGAHLANVLTKGLCVSATKSLLTNRMKNNESSVTTTDKKKVVLQPPILDWEEFGEILTLVEICLMKWANQLARSTNVSFSGLKLLGCFCEFLNHYLNKWRDQVSFDGVSFTSKVQLVYSKIILLLLKNSDILLKGVRNYSILCSTLKLGSSRDAFNLGSLWCICQDGEVSPIVQTQSPYSFWLPFTALLKTTLTLCPSLDAEPILQLLCHGRLASYLEDVCASSHSLSTQWFTRVEIHAICNILQLACLKGCKDYVLYHRTALTLMPLVHKGDEHIIKSLLADVVCNVDFIRDLSEVTMQINTLSVKDFQPLKSPAFAQPTISSSELTQRLIQLLPSVGQNLSKNLLHSRLLEKSLLRYNCIPFLVNDLSCERDVDVNVLDHYWCLSPLNMLLLLNDAKGDEASNQSEAETISSVVKWLQMTFLLLKYRKSVTVAHTNPTGWFRHLSNVFLASNDLFLDASVNSYVQASLSVLFSDEAFKELSWSVTFPDLLPCFDWFTRMVEHYSAVSYGDSCFALFLIVPLMRKWPVDYKLHLFGDHSAVLPFIRLTMEEVTQFIPFESFVSPPEDDENVITKYKSALGGKVVNCYRNPFLFQVLSYHISQFENLEKK